MPDLAHTVLLKLLDLGAIKKERSRDVLWPVKKISDYPFENASTLSDFHETLKLAEKSNAIKLEWQKHYENEQLERIRLISAKELSVFLNKPFLPDIVATALSSVKLPVELPWLSSAIEVIEENWLKGKKAFGLELKEASKLIDLIKAITIIKEGFHQSHPLDYRQFGARYLGDSKRTKELEKTLANLYRWHLGLEGIKANEILSQLNLVPINQPILLRGPLKFISENKKISCDFKPYLGIPVDCIETVSITSSPDYLITIENQSSFNEYTSTIQDNAIILYTAGFPTKSIQHLLRKATQLLDPKIPVYHWGDTDPHGFMILKTLQGCVQQPVLPYLMEEDKGTAYSKQQLAALKNMLPINQYVDCVIEGKLNKKSGLYEQEKLTAISPISL